MFFCCSFDNRLNIILEFNNWLSLGILSFVFMAIYGIAKLFRIGLWYTVYFSLNRLLPFITLVLHCFHFTCSEFSSQMMVIKPKLTKREWGILLLITHSDF